MRKAPLREASLRPVLILPPPALTELAVVSEMKAAALGLLSRRLALRLLSCAPLAAPPVLRAFAAESEQTPSEGFITPSGLRLFDFQTGLSAWSHSVPSWCHSLGSGRLGSALLRALKRRASAAQARVAADGAAVSYSRRRHRPDHRALASLPLPTELRRLPWPPPGSPLSTGHPSVPPSRVRPSIRLQRLRVPTERRPDIQASGHSR